MPIRLERLNCFMLFTLLLTCYVYTFPRWADPNQNSRLDMVVSVVDDGTFQIDKYVANTVDYAKVGEHYYSDKAPGVPRRQSCGRRKRKTVRLSVIGFSVMVREVQSRSLPRGYRVA